MLALTVAIASSVSFANEEAVNPSEHKFELAKQYYGQCTATDSTQFDAIRPQLKAFTDMEIMAETMADPAKFAQLMAVVNDPRMYMQWMMAPMNPAMYQPMMQMADPAYYTRWMNAMMNPAFYQPITSMADPNWYTPRINWMMNPQSMQPMFNMMNMGGYAAPQPQAGATASNQ